MVSNVETEKPKGRGRPATGKAKGPYVPTGKPRGRTADPNTVKFVYEPTGKPRGRKAGQTKGWKRREAIERNKAKKE